MMINTADGLGMASPIDFHERSRPRSSKTTLIATGVVVAAHIGLGAAIYYQRFETPLLPAPPRERAIEVFNYRPKPPESVKPSETPPAPNPRLNDTPRPLTPTDTIAATPTDAPSTTSTTLTFHTEVPDSTPDRRAEPGPTPTPPTAIIRNPTWSRQPSGDQMMRAYPQRGIAAGVTGSASLNCLVLPTGAVTDCNVTSETPGGYGFGRAAEGLSRYFRINPRTVNGAAEGSRVNINLRFSLPED
jgi:periplasmic protein TonB